MLPRKDNGVMLLLLAEKLTLNLSKGLITRLGGKWLKLGR